MPFRRQTRKRCRRGASPLTRRLILPGRAALQPALLPRVVFESSSRDRIDWLIFQLQDLFIGGAGGPISSYLLRPLNDAAKRESGEEAQDAHTRRDLPALGRPRAGRRVAGAPTANGGALLAFRSTCCLLWAPQVSHL